MNDFLAALLLGIIEGLTEFLPISSTGHLLIAEYLLDRHYSALFIIAIQAGAILAMTLIYWKRLWGMLQAFVGKDAPAAYDPLGINASPAQSRDYAYKLLAAFAVTALGGLLVKKLGWELPDTVRPIAWALIIGAVWMVLAEQWAARSAERRGERTQISWTVAILVGAAQVLAGVFPGTSRSAATIFVALLAGTTSRAAATEFAFVIGIPTMFAATGYELLSLYLHGDIGAENWGALAVACAASALTAFVAVKWLLHYIQNHRFTVFAVYRLVLGGLLLLWLPAAA